VITRVLAVGLVAGLISGICIAVVQVFTTTPLILQAEAFEGAPAHQAHVGSPIVRALATTAPPAVVLIHAEHGDHAAWAPEDGFERALYTGVATIGTAVGFALLLVAGMLAVGDPISERRAVGWASAAFVATGLAPAMGLPPELPGMAAADLVSRQQWWVMTAVVTAVALWMLLRSDAFWLHLLAVGLLLAPHVIGAPHLSEALQSGVPAELAARFTATSLAVQASLWVLTGYLVGVLWPRLGEPNVA